MQKIDWKQIWTKTWPHLVAIVTFVLLVMIYFAPQVFENKQLPQGDMISARGMGHDAREYHEQTGEWSHWSNSMFGGMPYNVTSGVDSKSIFRPISTLMKVSFHGETTAVLWLLLIGFYIFMLAVGSGPWLGIVGAIAFAFGSYNLIIIGAGHVTKGWVLATVPAVIGGCMLCYQKKYIVGFIVTLLATGLNVYWNHQQISYYTLLMLVPLAVTYLIYAIREKKQKQFWTASAALVVAAIMAIAPAMDKLLPTWDYSKETMRGGAVLKGTEDSKAGKSGLNREYAFQWSYGKAETMTLLIPNFYGGSSNYALGEDSDTYKTVKKYAGSSQAKQIVKSLPTYWGDQPFTSGPVYAGAIICFLFVLGLLAVKGPERWWLLVAVIIGILLSWGRNLPSLNNWLFDHLPLYNKFRTPSMSLVMTTTAMAMLGMLALRALLKKEVELKHIYIATGITGGLCLLFALFPGMAGGFTAKMDAQLPEWLSECLLDDRRAMLTSDAWRSLCLILLAAIVLFAYLKIEKMRSGIVIALMGVLILADLWTVDKRFLNDDHFVPKKRNLVTMTEADKQILADKDPNYRVLNLTTSTFNDAQTSYFHKSVGGYSPAKLRRYQDIIDYYFAGNINMNVLNMLNTRYVITQQGVQYNPEAFGNAWFVQNIDWVNNPNEEIAAIGNIDLLQKAVIDTCWRTKVSDGLAMTQPASIRLTNYANPGNLFYESESSEDGLAVFSEVYYKTWKAFIDGKEVPVVRANYILRAIEVPAGKHTIEFRCEDDLLLDTQIVSTIASCLVVLVIILLLVFRRKIEKA
ncbi:MAG: hypothetical protein U0K81_03385 [Paludibacteraceae bacterium]|nr:hypothetical protein [Paludibacteraceae bacterium]